MPSTRAWFKRRRQRLIAEQDNKCMYCGCEMVFFPLKYQQRSPSNYATIEHTQDRFSIKRIDHRGKKETLGVACFKCNTSRRPHKGLPFKILMWYKSARYPNNLTLFIPVLRAMGFLVDRYIIVARRVYQAHYDIKLYLNKNK